MTTGQGILAALLTVENLIAVREIKNYGSWPWPSKNSSWFCFGENTLLNTFSCTPRWVLTTKFCFWSVLSYNISVLTYS